LLFAGLEARQLLLRVEVIENGRIIMRGNIKGIGSKSLSLLQRGGTTAILKQLQRLCILTSR